MTVNAAIAFKQGATTTAPGVAMIGTTGTSVIVSNGDDTNVENWEYEVVDVPPTSTVATGVQSDGGVPSYTFTPDIAGGYLLHIVVTDADGNTAEDYRVFQVYETSGRIIPPFKATDIALNFIISGHMNTRGWATFQGAYDKEVDVLAAAGGGTPTGTGFPHVTAGVQDPAARAVNLASSDVSNVLALANGGLGFASASSPGEVRWTNGLTPFLDQAAPTTDVATHNFTVQPQGPWSGATSNKSSANFIVNIPAPIETGSFGSFIVTLGGTPGVFLGAMNAAQIGGGVGISSVGSEESFAINSDSHISLDAISGSIYTSGANFYFFGGGASNVFSINSSGGISIAGGQATVGGATLSSSSGSGQWFGHGGTTTQFAPSGTGTINTQAAKNILDNGYLTTPVDTAATTLAKAFTLPVGQMVTLTITIQGKVIADGTSSGSAQMVVGDFFSTVLVGTFINVSGTPTQAGASGANPLTKTAGSSTTHSNSMSNCDASATFAANTINVNVITAGTGSPNDIGEIDWMVTISGPVN